MRPEIHFDSRDAREWVGKTFQELYEKMEFLRRKIKEATDYTWDNSSFYIDGVYGRPCLQVTFYYDEMSFWNAKNGASMGAFMKTNEKNRLKAAITGTSIIIEDECFTEKMAEEIREWCHKIDEELTQCNECGAWTKEYKPYSYAGAVCEKCYDPKRHLGPDTRGD